MTTTLAVSFHNIKVAPRSNSNFSKSSADVYVKFCTSEKGIGILKANYFLFLTIVAYTVKGAPLWCATVTFKYPRRGATASRLGSPFNRKDSTGGPLSSSYTLQWNHFTTNNSHLFPILTELTWFFTLVLFQRVDSFYLTLRSYQDGPTPF